MRCTPRDTGLFRTMPEPDERAVRRLRLTAKAFGVDWPATDTLADLGRRLDRPTTRSRPR